jgi:hypothetical protein
MRPGTSAPEVTAALDRCPRRPDDLVGWESLSFHGPPAPRPRSCGLSAGTQLLFRFIDAAYERRSIGIGSHWPFESWGPFLPENTTVVSLLDRLLHHWHA